MKQLSGKVAVVTGAGRGIGRVLALALAGEGAALVLAGRSAAHLAETAEATERAGALALAVPTDVADPAQVERLAEAAAARFGRVDILVNNAGIPGPTRNLWEIDPCEWDETLAANLTGPYLCARAFLPGMMERRWGRIVNVSSLLGRTSPPMRAPYAASKAGLVAMSRSLAAEAGPYGVTVNVISPGAVAGDRLDLVHRRQAEARGLSFADVRQAALDATPVRRLITAEDVAAALLFLVSDAAGAVTGEDLNVTGGRAMW